MPQKVKAEEEIQETRADQTQNPGSEAKVPGMPRPRCLRHRKRSPLKRDAGISVAVCFQAPLVNPTCFRKTTTRPPTVSSFFEPA